MYTGCTEPAAQAPARHTCNENIARSFETLKRSRRTLHDSATCQNSAPVLNRMQCTAARHLLSMRTLMHLVLVRCNSCIRTRTATHVDPCALLVLVISHFRIPLQAATCVSLRRGTASSPSTTYANDSQKQLQNTHVGARRC